VAHADHVPGHGPPEGIQIDNAGLAGGAKRTGPGIAAPEGDVTKRLLQPAIVEAKSLGQLTYGQSEASGVGNDPAVERLALERDEANGDAPHVP